MQHQQQQYPAFAGEQQQEQSLQTQVPPQQPQPPPRSQQAQQHFSQKLDPRACLAPEVSAQVSRVLSIYPFFGGGGVRGRSAHRDVYHHIPHPRLYFYYSIYLIYHSIYYL